MNPHDGNAEPLKSKQDLYILLSLLLVILMHPVLDHGRLPRLILAILTFIPLVIATIRMAQRGLVWPLIVVLTSSIVAGIASGVTGSWELFAIHRAFLAVAFGMTVVGLFSYLRRATAITDSHLFTAVSVYLLLAMVWFAIYSAIAAVQPNSFQQTTAGATSRPADLLYFSLVTLTTLGYGDIVPLGGELRMLATLEAATGVLYIAITVALLVSSYKVRPS